jgi:hypothetical protein
MVPVGNYGADNYTANWPWLKRTDFHIRVGNLFHLDAYGQCVTRSMQEKIMEEMMYRLALVLPPENRGA